MGIFAEQIIGLERALSEKELTTKTREDIPGGKFAVPGKRKLPIHDAAHVRNAMARFNQTKGLTSAEKGSAFSAIVRAAKKFGVEVDDFMSRKPS